MQDHGLSQGEVQTRRKGKRTYKKQGMLVIRSFSLTIEVKNA